MAGEPDSAASQAVDALGREVAALTRENARLAEENARHARESARLAGELQQRTDELRQSREYQAAIGEVLAAISRSTVDLAPILQTLADTALRLCEAEMGFIVRRDGEAFFVVTAAGATPEIAADAEEYRRYQAARPIAVDRGSVTGRVALASGPVQIPDIAADPEYRLAGATQLGKIRTQVGVPLMREGRLAGVLILSRQRVEPFSERQVGLLGTFADQAVIAMENARLLGELRESLDQQTATGDVLKTISRSATDLGEVLDTLLATVARLCRADQAYMFRRHGELHHLVAAHGVPAEGEAFIRDHPFKPERGTTSGRVAVEKRIVHIHDVMADPEYDYAEGQRSAGFRTMLGLPLLREDTLLGVFVVCRTTVAPFTDKEIELASGFADQAMIAIENARLFEELNDRQAELRVTLDNTGDGVVMFDGDFRLASWNRNFQEMLDIPDAFVAGRPGYDDYLRLLVGRGELGDGDPESIVAGYRERAGRQWSAERTRPDGRIVEVRNNPVPDGGAVLIYSDITERKRAEAEIAAARDAAQEALEQQTATAEILKVIASSPTDVQPVLDAVVKAAVRFCGTTDAVILLRDGDVLVPRAHDGPLSYEAGSRRPLDRSSVAGWAALDGRTVHVPDADALDPVEFAIARRLAREHGFRASVATPLRREDTAIGTIILRNVEPGPFTPRQIELLETFAAQAVIAIENVRLFNDLSESLEQQTATSEILRVIASSPNDVQPVFDVVVKAAVRLCGAQDSVVVMRHGSEVVFEAHEGPLGGDRGDRWPLVGENVMGRAIIEGRTVHVADASALAPGEFDRTKHGVALYGFKAIVAAPLMRKGRAIGALLLRRREAGAYTPRQIELLETFAAQAVIAIENVRLFNDLSESLEQQTATADILRAISESPTNVQPVLDAVVKAALRFCGAPDALIVLRDGDVAVYAAHEGPIEARRGPVRLSRQTAPGRAMSDGKVVQIADLQSAEGDDFQEGRALGAAAGFRSALAAPLLRDDVAIGAISLRRPQAGAFTPRQVELLESFAAQAVIAIENVRLFTELRDALEQQTATADILRVISQSPTDVQPVLDAVVKATLRFCGAEDATITLHEGSNLVIMAHEGNVPGNFPGSRVPLDRMTVSGRAIIDGATSHLPDILAADPAEFRGAQQMARQFNFRAVVGAPLLHDGKAIGCVVLRKLEPVGFSERQIELLESFAAQAVIAIENVRLFTELRDALEQQTATADILKVIASSPTDVQPVLDVVAKAAVRFCGATDAMIQLRDGDSLVASAHEGPLTYNAGGRRPLDRAVREGRTAHFPDMEALDPVEFATARGLARQHGFRAAVATPLKREDEAIGNIVLRKVEPGPFTPQQIQLLETFAAQAVIAIENVRLFNDLREALDQQTATAEILQAISQSPTDVQPVLAAVARAAVRFCGSGDALIALRDGESWFAAAHEGAVGHLPGSRSPVSRENAIGRAIIDGRTCHLPNVPALDPVEFASARRMAVTYGFAAAVAAPLLRDGVAIGAVALRKVEPEPFTPAQIGMLETFAAQAVIAIENVRLFTELNDSLERQTATADILKVIASSPADTKPAFDAIAESANRLLGGLSTTVWRLEGEAYHLAAFTPTNEEADRALREMTPLSRAQGDTLAPAAAGRSITEIPDTESGPLFMREIARLRGFRACLAVSLAIDGQSIGFVNVTRRDPGTFRPDDVQLLKTFADQAVIAVQNARLFSELSDALEQQTATAGILSAISRSPTDVQPVLEAVTRAALRFCGAPDALVLLRDGDENVVVAHEGTLTATLGLRRPITNNFSGQALLEGRTLQIADVEDLDPAVYAGVLALARQHKWRASAAAPMMHGGKAIGCVVLRKPEPGLLSPRQIALLETFAAQAVIAIENVRLFTELRESLDQQAATSDVLKVIASSPTDVAPVLDAVAKAAQRFCGAADAVISLREGDEFVRAAHEGSMPFVLGRSALDRSSISGCAIVDARTTHIPDLGALDANDFAKSQTLAVGSGARAALAAPMLREGVAIGCILLRRTVAGPFAPKQIELLEAFAAQAVIAIENVRLFTELRDSLERLKAAQANLVQSEKMASLGQLTAGIAHEIKNPLNFVNNFAALSVELLDELKEATGGALAALDEDTRAEVDETMALLVGNLGKIAEHGKRADGIVRSMLSHSRGGSGDWTPSDINALVEEALNLAYHGARAQDNEFNVTLERDLEKSARPIELVPQDVTRVFLNLIGNGFYAVGKRRTAARPAGFRPTLRVSTRDLGEAVEVRVRDNGTGIPPEVREKLFQPFFTTKPTGEGTGLGLSISYDIVTQQHGGTIEVESEPGSFTEFTVRLPRRRVQTSSSERA